MFFSPAPQAEKNPISGSRRVRVFFCPSPRTAFGTALSLAHCFAPLADAGLVHWGSPGFVVNADSHGVEWDRGYLMEAGIFTDGFVPTFQNREQWPDHWHLLGSAPYDTEEKRFAGVIDTDREALPTGTIIYFWAKNGTDLRKGPEWVLLTHPSWKWPSKSSAIAPAVIWTTGEDLLALVVGDVGQCGKHLISKALRPVPISKSKWLENHFPNDAAAAAPDADPDHDGLSNTLEYFLGSDPQVASSAAGPVISQEGKSVKLNLQLNPYAESDYILEGSEDLKTWFEIDHEPFTERPDLLETAVTRDPSKKTLFFRFQLKPKVASE